MSQSEGKNNNFRLLTADNDGALTVCGCGNSHDDATFKLITDLRVSSKDANLFQDFFCLLGFDENRQNVYITDLYFSFVRQLHIFL